MLLNVPDWFKVIFSAIQNMEQTTQNLAVIFDADLRFNAYVNQVMHLCFLEMKIVKIKPFLIHV